MSYNGPMHARRGILALTFQLGLVVPAAAFHDGGTAHCGRCHIMHGGTENEVVIEAGAALLTAPTATDLCLTCHAEVMAVNPLAPPPERGAGNFGFLVEDNLNDAPDGIARPIAGEAAGHSIVSFDLGLAADSRWTRAPGGAYPSASLGCTSCHDPHGNASFRLLNGAGPIQGGAYQFYDQAPAAAGLACCTPGAHETATTHTAYLAGVSAWCANCHGDYHAPGSGSSFIHPVDEPLGPLAYAYGAYDGTRHPHGGAAATSYLPQVPFEDPANAADGARGPNAGSRLMCLSCHRAHASSAPAAGRWDFNLTRLDDDGRISGSYPLPNPFPGPEQGPLCAKCHENPTEDD